jgi:hypothetical protein
VLVNVDRILLVQQSNSAALFPVFEEPEVRQNQAGGTIILFALSRLPIRSKKQRAKIQHGPYVMNDHA